jgi:hypothetical protein
MKLQITQDNGDYLPVLWEDVADLQIDFGTKGGYHWRGIFWEERRGRGRLGSVEEFAAREGFDSSAAALVVFTGRDIFLARLSRLSVKLRPGIHRRFELLMATSLNGVELDLTDRIAKPARSYAWNNE